LANLADGRLFIFIAAQCRPVSKIPAVAAFMTIRWGMGSTCAKEDLMGKIQKSLHRVGVEVIVTSPAFILAALPLR
jgi:hypothetical protein